MKKHQQPTKLEEALLKVHLDIDGDKNETLEAALHQIRQLTKIIIGQHEIESHDVSMVVQILVKERNKLRTRQTKKADELMGKSN